MPKSSHKMYRNVHSLASLKLGLAPLSGEFLFCMSFFLVAARLARVSGLQYMVVNPGQFYGIASTTVLLFSKDHRGPLSPTAKIKHY